MFHDFIVQPIFNLLVTIYALLPGHDFGIAIILFTVIIRLLMWPLVRRQLHQTKLLRQLQPELKRIKAAAAGNKQKESMMLMELYKERGVSPFRSIGTIIVQFIILIGLYIGLKHVLDDPRAILQNSYNWVRDLGWMQTLQTDIGQFKQHLFGVIDLSKAAIGKNGEFYLPAMLLVIGSAAAQYFQSVQLMPKAKDQRGLKQILREAGEGKTADQTEVSAAVSRSMRFFIPGMVLIFTVSLPAALSLYWMVGGIVAYIQQGRVLGKDEEEMEQLADAPSVSKKSSVIEGEVIAKPTENTKPVKKAKPSKSHKKRRK